jgi:hypothetical protein
MKKLILIAVVAGGLAFASAPRSDAQVYFSVGFGRATTGPTIGLIIGTAGIATTVTSGIITIIGTKLP